MVDCSKMVPTRPSSSPTPPPTVVTSPPTPPTGQSACDVWIAQRPDWIQKNNCMAVKKINNCKNKFAIDSNNILRACMVKESKKNPGTFFCGHDTANPVDCSKPAEPVCSAPSACDLSLLDQALESAINANKRLAAQFLRMSFHDAGTFSSQSKEGGANGCLLTDARFVSQNENGGLPVPVSVLATIKADWEKKIASTCVKISAADIIQYAGLFAVVHTLPSIDADKHQQKLSQFQWGRPDATNCNPQWTNNLPGFSHPLSVDTTNLEARLEDSGIEIQNKMLVGNGFTAREATVLIGAHTIGQTRSVFGGGNLAGPWVDNGHDNGPVFDNTFFTHMVDNIFGGNNQGMPAGVPPKPFTFPFRDWFLQEQEGKPNLQWLDTDVALAFPHTKGKHPNFFVHSKEFAADNNVFLNEFFIALDKMSKLGVTSSSLVLPARCIARTTSVASLDKLLQTDIPAAEEEATTLLDNFEQEQSDLLLADLNNPDVPEIIKNSIRKMFDLTTQ